MQIDGNEWKLAPTEPTLEMRLAAWLAWKTFEGTSEDERMQAALREAVAAAPTPPATHSAHPKPDELPAKFSLDGKHYRIIELSRTFGGSLRLKAEPIDVITEGGKDG